MSFKVFRGCPQGSCLGPLFWTLIADQILKKVSLRGDFVAFADDFLLLAAAKSRRSLEDTVNVALESFIEVSGEYKLEVSVEKSEAVLFGKGRKLVRKPIFKIGEGTVKIGSTMRYLGVVLDEN